MRIDRVAVKQIVLHLADDLAVGRQVAPENAVARHAPQLAGHALVGAQQFHKQGAMAGVAAEVRVDQVAVFANEPDRLRGDAQRAGVVAGVQKHLEKRCGVFFEHVLTARGHVAVAQFESLVDRHDVHLAIGLQHGLIEGQHQYFVELRQGQRPAVVELHKLLYSEFVAIDKSPDRGQFTLMIEQQAVFFAARDGVQRVANAP